jgi:hypothetical protein
MAHEINKNDIQQGVKMAWHGLTEIMPEITLDNNWLTKWDLNPVKLQKNGKDTKWEILECSDIPELEIGSPYNPKSFRPITNAEFLELVRQSISGTSHKIVSVGSLRNRGRVFLSLELQGMENFVAAGREFSAFLNFGNGHDKSSVLWCNTSSICTVCSNTFTSNLIQVENKASKVNDDDDDLNIRKRHTKNANLKLPEIAKLIDKAVGVQGEFAMALDKLATIEIAKTDAKALFAGFIGRNSVADVTEGLSTRASNTVDKILELHVNGKGNNGRDLADAFNGITDYFSHYSSGGKNVNRQIISSDYGAGQVAKSDFWSIVNDNSRRSEMIVRGDALLTATV